MAGSHMEGVLPGMLFTVLELAVSLLPQNPLP